MKRDAISEPFEIECSITAGILKAKNIDVTPISNSNGKVVYRIGGNAEQALQEIYANCQVGALDVLQSIKFTRSAIFALRGGHR
jgi:hypothetical protein